MDPDNKPHVTGIQTCIHCDIWAQTAYDYNLDILAVVVYWLYDKPAALIHDELSEVKEKSIHFLANELLEVKWDNRIWR